MILKNDALAYSIGGKIGTKLIKPSKTQHDLSLAYSPGVAFPCLEIANDITQAYNYTNKANMVGVITNGTAVLGLGNIGAQASKPVMEGKALLFKRLAKIDAIDIEIDETNVEKFCSIVKALEASFGAINLEDIKAPQCFEIEKILKEKMNIPVMHDDQHGTAIVVLAGLINALYLTKKKLTGIKVVINGAGAAAIAIGNILLEAGVLKSNIYFNDTKGVVSKSRNDLNQYKQKFAHDTNMKNLSQILEKADVFIGVSIANVLTSDMLLKMADNPVIFALANPDPEINYNLALKTRSDVIMCTGRSDYPNQINNASAFPFIFRAALDTRAKDINTEMKIAAAEALAELARKDIPKEVLEAYKLTSLTFGKNYIIPKPLDPRLLEHISVKIAQASIKSGAARYSIKDWCAYANHLKYLSKEMDN